MGKANTFSLEVREWVIRLVVEQARDNESQWAVICSVAEKIGCTAETLRRWVRQAERDQGMRKRINYPGAELRGMQFFYS